MGKDGIEMYSGVYDFSLYVNWGFFLLMLCIIFFVNGENLSLLCNEWYYVSKIVSCWLECLFVS